MGFLHGIAVDTSGNIYVTDESNSRIRKVTPDGTVSTIAGTGAPGSADGNASSATFNSPIAIALDKKGIIYVGDGGNYTIRKIVRH